MAHWTGEQRGKLLPFPLQGEYGGTGPGKHVRWGGLGRMGWGGCSSGVLGSFRGDRRPSGETEHWLESKTWLES